MKQMKTRTDTIPFPLAALLLLATVGALPVSAAPTPPPPAKPVIKQSVFVYPSNASEGRDPFFPNSTRAYFFAKPTKPTPKPGASLTDLILKSIIGTPPHYIAVINNHAFAVGDDGDIFTKTGHRLRIHCADINPQSKTVTVEANGTSIELNLSKEP